MLNVKICSRICAVVFLVLMIIFYFLSDRLEILRWSPIMSVWEGMSPSSASSFHLKIELELNDRFDEFIPNERWRSERIVGLRSAKSTLFLSTIRSIDEGLCYVYLQMWTNDYRSKSFRISSTTTNRSISLPRIFSLKHHTNRSECPRSVDAHLIEAEPNQLTFILNIDDLDKGKSDSFIFDSSTHSFDPLESSLSPSSVPLLHNDQLYLVESIQPLRIRRCSTKRKPCRIIYESNSTIDDPQLNYLSPSTGLLPFGEHSFGFVQSRMYLGKCDDLIRCHLIVLTTSNEYFSLRYLRDP